MRGYVTRPHKSMTSQPKFTTGSTYGLRQILKAHRRPKVILLRSTKRTIVVIPVHDMCSEELLQVILSHCFQCLYPVTYFVEVLFVPPRVAREGISIDGAKISAEVNFGPTATKCQHIPNFRRRGRS